VATLFTLSTPAAIANTVTVVNCDDTGQGSLRSSVLAAGEGDTVDLRQLPSLGCSTITLKTGSIVVPQNSLTLLGPDSGVTVSGRAPRAAPENDRILYHLGTGTLRLDHLTVRDGNLTGPSYAFGGCISSTGSVYLLHTDVQACIANGALGSRGGGVSSKNLTAKYSSISGNTAGGSVSYRSYGGGVYVLSTATIEFSTISGNDALSSTVTGAAGIGGGGDFRGNTSILGSTISGNHASYRAGGLELGDASVFGYSNAAVTNSTVSGNSAGVVGGIYALNSIKLQNSTVAFNSADAALRNSYTFAPGVTVVSATKNFTAILQSTLISNNTYAGAPLDFSSVQLTTDSVSLSGANNLIRTTFSAVPNGTLTNVCPRLGVLRDNGGTTQTHALLSFSAAIDAGNDVAIDPISNLPYSDDQRGLPRVDHGTADIGAYERQQADIVFNDAFDDCG
jgi:hypothetical protein